MKWNKVFPGILALTILLSGCGAAGGSTAESTIGDLFVSTPSNSGYGSINLSPAEDVAWEPEMGADLPAGGSSEKDIDLAEKLIYSANVTVETMEFDAAIASLNELAGTLGGFIQSSDVSGRTSHYPDGSTRVVDRSANYVLRVPADRFQEAINKAGDLGSVTNTYTTVENITSSFIDQDARKHSLEVQEERLLNMLEKAEDVQVLVELETRLADVRYEIESIERTLRNWQQQVDYSTLTITLHEVAAYTPTASIQRTFGERLGDAFRDSWNGFVRFGQNLVLFLVYALPALAVLAVFVTVVIVLIKVSIRKRKAKRAQDRTDA